MTPTRSILLVEDEHTLRLSMVRGLSKLDGIAIRDAGTLREAKRLIGVHAPDLVISDLDLPDGSGIEVAAELEKLGMHAPIVFVSAYVDKFRHRIPTRGDIEVYEKPVGMDRLRAMVEEKLTMGPRSPFAVTDYVQLASMGGHSVAIEVWSPAERGRIVIVGGDLWSAEDGLGSGLEALRRMVFLGGTHVACRTLRKGETTVRNIEGPAESVLLDLAREHDEAVRSGDPVTSPASSIPVDLQAGEDEWADVFAEASVHVEVPPALPTLPRPLSAQSLKQEFDEAFETAVDALLEKDFPSALGAFLRANAIQPSEPRVLANLKRLREMGFT
jgi:CheY-like chemotaxis protein